MSDDDTKVYHWIPDQNRWDFIPWDAFLKFRGHPVHAPLPGIAGGIHHFVVCALDDDGVPVNLIPHKYLIELDGNIGPDNFTGWNREDRDDYMRLMTAREHKPGDTERLREIQDKAGNAWYPPKKSIYALANALPKPPKWESGAELFLDAALAETTRAQLQQGRQNSD